MSSDINKRLLKEFKKTGMTRYKLKQLTGVPHTTLQRWSEGSNISIKSSVKIADALGLQIVVEEKTNG